jgi:hypothetical protein
MIARQPPGMGLSRAGVTAVLAAILALTAGIERAPAQAAQHVLTNLSSGAAADPLPPLRANRPSAAEMAAKPRRHPYMFFDAGSRQALRDRAQAEPFRGLAQRLQKDADECLARPVPSPATIRDDIPEFLANGSYNPAYLREFDRNQFGVKGYLMAKVIPTLGFAYQLTGQPKYAEAGRRWLLSLASWKKFGTKGKEADFDAGHFAYALALGYDWLWEVLDEPGRRQVQEAVTRIAGPMMVQAKDIMGRPHPQLNRGYMEGNHPRRTHGLFSLVPLAVLYEVPAAQGWLDTEIQYQRDRLYPSAFAPDGEHADAWDHFSVSLDEPTPFVVALQRMGGEDLFNDPQLAGRFRGLPRFFLYGLEQRFDQRWYLTAWFALASRLKDPLAQWIATRPDALRLANEVFAYLFYDPQVPAIPPQDPPGSVYFPYTGMVKMCSDWTPDGILVPFRCGPEVPKEKGDQNGFRLRAGGQWLLPRLQEAQRKPEEPAELTWDLLAWYNGSPAQNVVLVDPDQVGDYATYAKTGRIPIKGGVQFNEGPVKGRQYSRQWLSGPEFPKRGQLRVVVLDDALDYVCGEAHRAFVSSGPALWVRHVLFVKARADGRPAYVLICDELEAGQQPQTFAWQLHPRNPFTIQGRDLTVRGSKAELDVHFLAPADGVILEKQTPAPMEKQRLRFIQWRTPAAQSGCVYLTAMAPRAKASGTVSPSFAVKEAAGGWGVEVRAAGAVDLVLFRSERATAVTVEGLSTTGTAALLRKRPTAGEDLYIMGR